MGAWPLGQVKHAVQTGGPNGQVTVVGVVGRAVSLIPGQVCCQVAVGSYDDVDATDQSEQKE